MPQRFLGVAGEAKLVCRQAADPHRLCQFPRISFDTVSTSVDEIRRNAIGQDYFAIGGSYVWFQANRRKRGQTRHRV
jgi:hypothetical protein